MKGLHDTICTACDGKGWLKGSVCPRCSGLGRRREPLSLDQRADWLHKSSHRLTRITMMPDPPRKFLMREE